LVLLEGNIGGYWILGALLGIVLILDTASVITTVKFYAVSEDTQTDRKGTT